MTSVRDCVRCQATTARGTRCSRITCIYPKYCFQHFRAKKGLRLAPSNIPGAGLGLFTTRAFQPNRKIAPYSGTLFDNASWEEDKSDYGVKYSEDQVLDGRSTQDGIARYANQCQATDRRARFCRGNNSQLRKTLQNNIILESRGSRIPAGREIFVNYGDRYWDRADGKKVHGVKRSKSVEY